MSAAVRVEPLRLYARREPATVAVCVLLLLIVSTWVAVTPNLSELSVTNTIGQKLPLVMAAIGQTIVILSRGIDLSVGGSVTLANVIVATGSLHDGNTLLWIGVALLVVSAFGALNGILVGVMGLPALIVTLATQSVMLGTALYVLPNPGGTVAEWFSMLSITLIGPVPVVAVLMVVVPFAVWWPLRRSRFGGSLYAVGNDPAAAFVSGVNVTRTLISAYALSGFFAALGGVFLAMYTASGDPSIGISYTLNSIAAAVVGGVLLKGGRGTIVGAVAGALVLAFISNLLFGLGISAYWQHVVTGVILITAIGTPYVIGLIRRNRSAAR